MSKQAKVTKSIDKSRQLFFFSLVVLALSLLILLYAIFWSAKESSNIVVSASVQQPVPVVSTISMGVVDMKVQKVSFQAGQKPFVAPPGKQYAVVSFEIKNRSDKPIQISPTTDMYVKSASGDVSYITPYAVTQPFRAGQLLPGETIRGDLSYLVRIPGQSKFYIDAIWSGGVIPFAMN